MKIELHQIVFRMDYDLAPRFFDRQGACLAHLLSNPVMWKGYMEGQTPRTFGVRTEEGSPPHANVWVEPKATYGLLEDHPISSLDKYRSVFQSIGELFGDDLLAVASFARIGVRFKFLYPQRDFSELSKRFLRVTGDKITKCFSGEIEDVGYVFDISHKDDRKLHAQVGPVRKSEMRRYFEQPNKVTHSAAIYCDLDEYSAKHQFKTLRLDRVIDVYHSICLRIAEEVASAVAENPDESPETQMGHI